MKKRKNTRGFFDNLRRNRTARYKRRLKQKVKLMGLKEEAQKTSHSLLWVWEFSKKAVLICFMFYVIVQVYAMVVMVRFYDFTYLGELISETGDILQNCVFAYLIKAGLENIGKIWFSRGKGDTHDEPPNNDPDEPVG